ncbi:hypothetical protein E5D57_003304 [Metarhizium anisopliae]|nr:hypothetical protein E5D57_003304 [Metarhizium anisopliae]
MVNPWFSWSEFSRVLAKAAAAVHPPVTKRWKWRRGGGREKPFEGIKSVRQPRQLAFREKNLRDQPPLFRRAGLPIPIAPWFRKRL